MLDRCVREGEFATEAMDVVDDGKQTGQDDGDDPVGQIRTQQLQLPPTRNGLMVGRPTELRIQGVAIVSSHCVQEGEK